MGLMVLMSRKRWILCVIGLSIAAVGSVVSIRRVRTWVLPWTANRILEVTVLTYPPWGFSVASVGAGSPARIPVENGRVLRGDFFGPNTQSTQARGRILFIHGSIPKGRRFGLYRFLCGELAARGYAVLLPDIGGYGESLVPPDRLPTFGRDVRAAAKVLLEMTPKIETEELVVIAHSLGGSMALEAIARCGLRPSMLVLWDPWLSGRRATSSATKDGQQSGGFRSEIQVEGGGRLTVSEEEMLAYVDALNPLVMLRKPPQEMPATLAALTSVVDDHSTLVAAVGTNSQWLTILDLTGMDHYLDSVSLGKEGQWLIFRRRKVAVFLEAVEEWLAMTRDRKRVALDER